MLTPNQILLLNDFFTHNGEIYFLCEKYDCDVDQMTQIVGEVMPLLPGKGIDFNGILSKDPIASDPLVIQCNRTIGQFDQLYDRLLGLYDNGFNGYATNKRTTFNPPSDGVDPSFHNSPYNSSSKHNGTEKIETTNEPNKQRFRILEAAAKCLDRSLKTQITLTQRKERLLTRINNAAKDSNDQSKLAQPRKPDHEMPHVALQGINGHAALRGYPASSFVGASDPFRGAVAPPTAGIQDPLSQATDLADSLALPLAHPLARGESEGNSSLNLHLAGGLPSAGEVQSTPNHSIENFGPPKPFTQSENIAEFHENPYSYRDALKTKKRLASVDPLTPPASSLTQSTDPLARRASEGNSSLNLQLSPIANNPPSQPEASASLHLPGGLPSAGKVQCAPPQKRGHTTNNVSHTINVENPPTPNQGLSASIRGFDPPPHHQRE